MAFLAAQLTPQRSTQYADLVKCLAPHEITLSQASSALKGKVTLVEMGGQEYLLFEIGEEWPDSYWQFLQEFAMTNSFFFYHEAIGEQAGPFLQPVTIPVETFLPAGLVTTRRYRGKTNELLTRFMCNIARYSSSFRKTPWRKITLLDPLSGGGTTLFTGLVLGADVVGVEQDQKTGEGTAGFLKAFFKESRISARLREERLKGVGKRWFFTIKHTARCVIGVGDTSQVHHFTNGVKKPQLIVTDLPYGIQHRAKWKELLTEALPAWNHVMAEGGALVFSWNATHFLREEMISLVQEVGGFEVLNAYPYNQLGHRVDRVIKQRDILVAKRK